MDAAAHRTSELRRGYGRRPKAIKLHANRKDNYGRTCAQVLHVPKGVCVEVRACAMDPVQVFPAGRRWRPQRGSGRTPRRTSSGAAPTSPPEGVFRHKRLMQLDELSGRITGRLGDTWPTTAYAIGGTATLALRYSIIPASTAASTRPQ